MHSQEIDSKKYMIERIREENDEHLEFLTTEIMELKKEMSTKAKPEDQTEEESSRLLEELEARINAKEMEIDSLTAEYEEKMTLLF